MTNPKKNCNKLYDFMIPETWHYFPDDIKEGIWAEGSLTPLPKGTECFPELLDQRSAQQSR